ncbi:MAG: hypothetical protein SNG02_05185 [Rikenellaceae bacterium]
MKRLSLLILYTLLSTSLFGVGLSQKPLYIVNGKVVEGEFDTNSTLVERIEYLSGEEAVEMYGVGASNGVVLVTLKFETPPKFSESESLRDHISQRITWIDEENPAQVIFKYRVDPTGRMEVVEILSSDSKKLTKRIYKVVEQMPLWSSPALNSGEAVESFGTERIKVPYKK